MRPRRRYIHWIAFDPSRRNAARITATLARGSGFRAGRVYLHPTRGDLYHPPGLGPRSVPGPRPGPEQPQQPPSPPCPAAHGPRAGHLP